MSSYTGLYVQRLSNGKVDSVQVVDPSGNSLVLDPETYIERQISPPIGQLPDIDDYKAAAAEPKVSPLILLLVDWVKGKTLSNEAIYRMQQFGFVYPDNNGRLQLSAPRSPMAGLCATKSTHPSRVRLALTTLNPSSASSGARISPSNSSLSSGNSSEPFTASS